MHSTRGLIRNNLHVPCSVFPLRDFVTLLVGASKIKAHIYLSIWVHPHRFDKSVPFLSVVHDRCNILPRKDQCHYLQLVYKMLLLGTPPEHLPCFGSQRSGWQIVPYTDQNWKEKKNRGETIPKKYKSWLFFRYFSWNNTKTIFFLQSSFLGCTGSSWHFDSLPLVFRQD